MSYSTATLTGTYEMWNGVPAQGTVEIIPNSPVLIDAEGDTILSGRVKADLDETGSFSVTLPSTDDTTVEPAIDRQYTVVAKLRHQHLKAVTGIELAGGETVDMADVTSAAATTASLSLFLTAEEYAAVVDRVAALEAADPDARLDTVEALTTSGRLSDSTLAATYARGISFTDPRIGGVGDGATDNTAAWNAAMTLLEPTGGMLFFPPGVYKINGTTNTVPGGVLLLGTGLNYGAPAGSAAEGVIPSRGAVIRAGAAMSRLISLGRNPNTSAQADTGASMRDLIVDGQNLADTVVKTAGRRNYIRDCQIYWGAVNGVQFAGQNSYLIGGVVAQSNRGDCVLIDTLFDHKVFDAQIREPGTTGTCVRVKNVGDVLIRGNHMWAGANGVTTTAESLITVEGSSAVVGIVNNILEGVLGPEILLNAQGGSQMSINISGNQFFNNDNSPDIIYPVVQATGVGGFLSDVNISANIIHGQAPTKRFKSLIAYSGTLAGSDRWVCAGNTCRYVQFPITGSANAPQKPRWTTTAFHDGSSTKRTENNGEAVFSGNGSTTTFDIAHGLIAFPASFTLSPSSVDAKGERYATLIGSTIHVTFTTAPPAGTNNVKLVWAAQTNG